MAFSRKSMVASVAGSLSLAMLTGCPAPNAPTASTSPSTAPSTSTPSTTPTGSPSAGTTSPSPSATASTTTQPGASGTASASPTVTTSAQPPSGKTTIVSGTVYDETGATVDGAVIKVNSLDTSVPYTATTTTSQGSWVVNSVPEGANVEIIATKDGWTSRRRVGSFQTQANVKNIVDFGGNSDAAGIAYFVSKFPEIASVDPGYDANNVDNTTVSYKLTLSEPLDATNQNRFANAIRLFPANSYAAPDNDGYNYAKNGTYAGTTTTGVVNPNPPANAIITGVDAKGSVTGAATGSAGINYYDLKDQRITPFTPSVNLDRIVDPDPTQGYITAVIAGNSQVSNAAGLSHPVVGLKTDTTVGSNVPWDYSIKNGTLFLNDANTRANVTWDATGQVATLTFNAPLNADRTNQARYQVGLVATSTSDRIVDKDNNQLGVDAKGNQNTYPNVGALIHATVKQNDLSLNLPGGNTTPTLQNVTGGAARWIGTHQDAARFAVRVDAADPNLVSVAYTKNLNQSSRFELTFDKPLAAYNGRLGGHVGSTIQTGEVLKTISFAVSDRTGGTANVDLKSSTTQNYVLNPKGGTKFGSVAGGTDIEKAFWLGSQAGGAPAAMGGSVNGGTYQLVNTATDIVSYGSDIRATENAGTSTNKYLLAVNASNPRTLFIYIVGQTSVFDPRIVELKVRAEGVPDPAGNTIKSAQADTNQKTTSIQ
jgi:hypothetical protein